ncbi:uncharacterized protein [Dysidea avara]|uniref:uncharacterized protein isoform X2 n=1 Tax=Dysidea avara TaxID=196820 RepID=UPI003327963E
MSRKVAKQKFISDVAADKALKQISPMDMLEQLNLFETIVQLYSIDGLTPLENEELQNNYVPELHRKSLLLTSIIPGKGHYKGMQMLRRSLKKTGQRAILSKLDKAYEKAVDTLKTRTGPTRWSVEASITDSVMTASCSSVGCASITSQELNADALCKDEACTDGGSGSHQKHVFDDSSSDNDDNESDNDNDKHNVNSAGEQCIQESTFQYPQDFRTSALVTPFRERSGHISERSNPRKKVSYQTELIASTIATEERFQADPLTLQSSSKEECQDALDKHDTMGSVHSVDQLRCNTPVLKIIIVGDTGTGKTSLLHQYVYNKFSVLYEPTIPLDFHYKELACNNTNYKLHLWDTAGQERFKAVTQAYYRDAVAAFVVYDVTNKNSLEHSLQWKEEINSTVYLTNGDPIPVVLIANKVDCGQLDGEQFSKDHGFIGYFETSAKTGQGIREAIHFIVKKVHQLSCAHQELVVKTLNRNRTNIMLHRIEDFSCDKTSNEKSKCCLSSA